jgi:hypothetical protein
MYDIVKSAVKGFDVSQSEYYECCLGVKQGECISPLLFSMYVNDQESELKKL